MSPEVQSTGMLIGLIILFTVCLNTYFKLANKADSLFTLILFGAASIGFGASLIFWIVPYALDSLLELLK